MALDPLPDNAGHFQGPCTSATVCFGSLPVMRGSRVFSQPELAVFSPEPSRSSAERVALALLPTSPSYLLPPHLYREVPGVAPPPGPWTRVPFTHPPRRPAACQPAQRLRTVVVLRLTVDVALPSALCRGLRLPDGSTRPA